MKTIFALRKRPRGYWRKLLLALFIELVGAILLLVWVGLPCYLEDRALHPARVPLSGETPAQYGFPYEDVHFSTADGVMLSAWYIPGTKDAAVILLHGAPGNRTSHLEQARLLANAGYGVLLVDQRSQGASEGKMISLNGEDAKAAVRYLENRFGSASVKIGLWGFSLGGYNSIQAAADLPEVRAVIADGIAATHSSDDPSPQTVLDVLLVPSYWVGYQVWAFEGATNPRSMTEAIRQISGRPILFVTGGKNSYEAQIGRLFYEAAGEPKELWEIPEADHVGGWTAHPEEYGQRALDFFRQVLE